MNYLLQLLLWTIVSTMIVEFVGFMFHLQLSIMVSSVIGIGFSSFCLMIKNWHKY